MDFYGSAGKLLFDRRMLNIQKVAVIGGGIIGVSSAVHALETIPNIEVTLISEKFSPHTTADGSAGFWCPYLLGDVPVDTLRFWCQKTFNFLEGIFKTPEASECGIGLLSCYYLSSVPVEAPPFSDIFLEWREINAKELALFPERYRYGAFLTTLYAECTKLIPILMQRFQKKGGTILKRKIERLSELSANYDVVINCPGVEAAYLVPDSEVTPIRGQVMRVDAPWIKHAVFADNDYYIVPNVKEVICGGTHQEGNWSRKVDPKDRKHIWNGCCELIPSLKAKVLREWVGLRPGRPKPRLERETQVLGEKVLEVIHNYGHGGSGVTLFWGCALQTTKLLLDALDDVETRKRKNRSKL
ncbi:D-aspartate oxidase-like isoform X2 [Stegodyphus dumicola]|uniref:D-aspartate oxidase-like isoform X2 n=1 Tax=Stegodyphus dumicola TaxID=202533 RepID=UPI0015ABDE0C|nr:D-aspartate oxidase-like isoform X2 [Stegodyphus dumicola]